MSEPWLGWHWAANNRRLGYGDGRAIVVGETLTVAGPLVLCKRGLHACRLSLNALNYAQGEIICRVRLSGQVLAPSGEDKACATERTVLAMVEAASVLHEFACRVAENALTQIQDSGRKIDSRLWAAIAAKRAWLKDEITGEQLAAARDTARAAAWDAARDTAWDAARDTAWAAARAAARAAAWDAARAAAWDAARAAAWDAARAAAWDAAWAAAWDAARAEQNALLEVMLQALLEREAHK